MIDHFPKIFAIGNKSIKNIFDGEVEITEKIDGSQFGFGKINGELFIRSKGAQLFPDNPEKMFKEGIEYIVSIQDKLPDNSVFWGEYLKTPKHNTLHYKRIPENYIMLFGGYFLDTGKFLSIEDLVVAITKYQLDFEVVPVIFKGLVSNPEQLKELIDNESILGNTHMEGVVIKNYNQNMLLGGQVIEIVSGKFVSEKFKEVHNSRWNEEEKGKSQLENLFNSYRTEARWNKAIQHLKEKGELLEDPKDIGKLMKEIHLDIEEEEKEDIKEKFWELFSGNLKRTSTAGFPEWYKEYLMKQSFENE